MSSQPTRVLITGACGFFASHLVEHMLKTSTAKLILLDKLTYASNGFQRLREIDAMPGSSRWGDRITLIGCDLAQPIPDGVVREIGWVDYIIHAAAETDVDRSIRDPMPFLLSNVIGTHHLLFLAKELRPNRVFLVNTDEIYGPAEFGDAVSGFDEHAPFNPANPYAASKAASEALAIAYANTYKTRVTTIVAMNLVGERQDIGKALPKFTRAIRLGEKIQIHSDETKTKSGSRFYLHCRTFADAILFLMSRDRSGVSLPARVHVSGEREISNLELAQIIAKIVDRPLIHEMVSWHTSNRPGHDLRYCLSDKLITQLGWKRPMLLEQSLEKTVKWYLDNPKWLEL